MNKQIGSIRVRALSIYKMARSKENQLYDLLALKPPPIALYDCYYVLQNREPSEFSPVVAVTSTSVDTHATNKFARCWLFQHWDWSLIHTAAKLSPIKWFTVTINTLFVFKSPGTFSTPPLIYRPVNQTWLFPSRRWALLIVLWIFLPNNY